MPEYDEAIGLTLRDLVLEIRDDVRALREETKVEMKALETRVSALEDSGLVLRGAWATLGVLVALASGIIGLGVGVYAIL